MIDPDDIRRRLARHGCDVASNHLNQAVSALARAEWESASAQVRSAVEALFERIAEVRLSSSDRGGAARKALQAKGILSDKQGKLVQSFVDYTGTGGSHAGRSGTDEARGRYLVALGIVVIGLDLLPELVRVQDVLSGLTDAPADDQVTTSCRTCGATQLLSECDLKRDGTDTVYVCKHGCQPLVVIGAPGASPWPGRGYRLRDYVIRNASDLILTVANSSAKVLIPASPAALMKSRPDATQGTP